MLQGKVVLVTGATQGIGLGIAMAAAAAGARVVVTGIDQPGVDAVVADVTARGGQAIAALCDVTRRDDVDRAVAETLAAFGRLDAFVHNANSAHAGRPTLLEELPEESWDDQVAVGLRALLFCARAALAPLTESRGSLLVLTSNAGIEGSEFLPGYSAVKGAQRGLVKGLAREWGPSGIRVNAMAPSAMTPTLEAFLEREPPMRAHLVKRAALRRFGDSEADIGRAMNFLIGDDSGFVTGQTLLVNGGALML